VTYALSDAMKIIDLGCQYCNRKCVCGSARVLPSDIWVFLFCLSLALVMSIRAYRKMFRVGWSV